MLVKGNFKTITELPKYIDINEWLAFNSEYYSISILYMLTFYCSVWILQSYQHVLWLNYWFLYTKHVSFHVCWARVSWIVKWIVECGTECTFAESNIPGLMPRPKRLSFQHRNTLITWHPAYRIWWETNRYSLQKQAEIFHENSLNSFDAFLDSCFDCSHIYTTITTTKSCLYMRNLIWTRCLHTSYRSPKNLIY